MINIKNYIRESIFDNPKEIAKKDIKVQPKNKIELRQIIEDEVNNCKEGETVDLNFIDTSKINDMSSLFNTETLNKFNYNISKWDVSNVEDFDHMFYRCNIFNCDLSNWNMSNANDISGMFCKCKNFNSDLSKWDVSNVIFMEYCFYLCENFNCDLSNWDVSNVTDMYLMFLGCTKFTGNGLENWDVSNVNDMRNIFKYCASLKKIPDWCENDND